MQITVTAQVERTEGLNRSRELVEAALMSLLDGEQLDVEDTQYDITEVEATDAPKSKGTSGPRLEYLLFNLTDAFFAANPVVIDGPEHQPTPDELDRLRRSLSALVFDQGVGQLVQREKIRRLKAAQR